MYELAPEPTAEQFVSIAQAITPESLVISTRELVGGISCRMDVMTFEAHGSTREVVVRQYPPWHANENPPLGIIEGTVLGYLSGHDIATPTLILGDETTAILGRPAIVISFVDGNPVVQPDELQGWAEQLVSAIVKVHAVPVTNELKSTVESLFAGYDRSFSQSEPSARIKKHSLGPRLWQRLKELWPTIDKSAEVLLHGDYWPGNTLWKSDSLVAIIDWEEPRIGNPSRDIAVLLHEATLFGMDIEKFVLNQYAKVVNKPLHDLEFWKAIRLMDAMPDPGGWVEDFMAMGGKPITPDQLRSNHTALIEDFLASG